MRGKLNELWALIGAVKAARERDAKGVSDGNVEWAVVDEEGLAQIAQARFPCCIPDLSSNLSALLTDSGRATGWPGLSDENSSARLERPGGDQRDGWSSGCGDELTAVRTLPPVVYR